MPRRQVEFRLGESYHVFNRGNNREKIFFDRDNYAHFLRLMRRHILGESNDEPDCPKAARSDFQEILSYCLMPNHFHFLVRVNNDGFADCMHGLQMAYSKAINKRFDRVGALFQGRYRAVHVDSEEYLIHLTRYIHLNPVEAQLCARPEHWEFSSYREYAGIRPGTLPNSESILRVFKSRDSYCRFVDAGIGSHDERIKHLLLD